MLQKLGFLLIVFLLANPMKSQELPYREIPDYPSDYGPGNIVSRMIDGLGFRFYWATEGLTEKDWSYKPSEESRSVLETLQHIYGMSEMILNAPSATPNIRPTDFSKLTYSELREKTLINLKAASKAMLGKQASDFEDFAVIFQRGEKQTPFPYWNLINGMLSDCIYHTGQITMLRRVTGNPINPSISVFTGKVQSN
ncbi:DinB family protein [Flagellimonas sp. S174]|uniref:DinB family protein n=1 Tax=Flagellimonas sp. S174 TaxID=3410790 RepID=UPI003BF55647